MIGDKSMNGYSGWSAKGIFVVIIRTNRGIYNYKSGIFSDPVCSNDIGNHVITLVGYDSQSWILRNSWGSGWGESGYFRFQRSSANICGIYDWGMIYA